MTRTADHWSNAKDSPETTALIARAIEWFGTLSAEERETHLAAQARSYARSEMAWSDEGTRVKR